MEVPSEKPVIREPFERVKKLNVVIIRTEYFYECASDNELSVKKGEPGTHLIIMVMKKNVLIQLSGGSADLSQLKSRCAGSALGGNLPSL